MLRLGIVLLGVVLACCGLMGQEVGKGFDFDRYLLSLYNRSRVKHLIVREVPLTYLEESRSKIYVNRANRIADAISAIEDSIVAGRYEGALVIIGRVRRLIEQDTTLLKYMFNYAPVNFYYVYAFEAFLDALRRLAGYDLEKFYSRVFELYQSHYMAHRGFHDSLAAMLPEEMGLVFYDPERDILVIDTVKNYQIDLFWTIFTKWKTEKEEKFRVALEELVAPIVRNLNKYYYLYDIPSHLRSREAFRDVDDSVFKKVVAYVKYMCEPFIPENIHQTLENFDRLDAKRKSFFLRLIGFQTFSFRHEALLLLRKKLKQGMLFVGEFHNHSGMYLYQFAEDPEVRRLLLAFESWLEKEYIEENLTRVSVQDLKMSLAIPQFVFEYLSPDEDPVCQLILLHRGEVVRIERVVD